MPPLRAAINVDCPSCGKPLPTVPVISGTGRFDGTGRGWIVKLDVDLNSAWWAEVNRTHISCVLL